MDLITKAVAAAIAQGAPTAASNTAPDSLADAYRRLKAAIGQLDGGADVLAAIEIGRAHV